MTDPDIQAMQARLTHLEQVVRDLDQDVQDLQTLRRGDATLIREVARGLGEFREETRREIREFREETRAGFQLIADLLRQREGEGQ